MTDSSAQTTHPNPFPGDNLLQGKPTLQALLPPPRCYARRRNFLSMVELQSLRQAILASPYLDNNQLSDGFQDSQGFSVIFTRSGIGQVAEQFPAFAPYLQRALKPACNAFYLNSLVLGTGTEVQPHVDCSLSSYAQTGITPNLVSVMYVQVPEDLVGGQLGLRLRHRPIATLPPETNMLVYFLGPLEHFVQPVQTTSQRISLVCEQYHLPDDMLSTIPTVEVVWGAAPASNQIPRQSR